MQLSDETDFLHAPRIQALKRQMESANSESEKQKFLSALVKEIVKAINGISAQKFDDSVNIKNFDEVTASLRNELSKANKPISELLKSLNISLLDQTKAMSDIEKQSNKDFNEQYQTVIVKRSKDIVHVDNLGEIIIPNETKINNLSELLPYFKGLESVVRSALQINLPAPQVNVQAPIVNVPETQVNIPPVDLSLLLESLDDITTSLKKLKVNDKSHPLAVRLTDGADWIKQLIKVQQETSKAVAAFAGGADMVRILDANKNIISPNEMVTPSSIGNGTKAVTTAGTAVALGGNVPCRKITMTALDTNTGKIYWGGSTVSATSGAYIYAGQTQVIDIDNLSKVYLDCGVNGEGVNYSYVA